MCTLACFRGVSPAFPLVVAANRDEFLGRASAAPCRTSPDSPVLAGRDLVAGGTWLGCRTDGSGRVAGILNRRPSIDRPASGPGERSRGLLCLDVLEAADPAPVVARLAGGEAALYGGFSLFVADLGEAFVVDNGRGARRVELGPGLSVLTNLDLNDPRCPRLVGAARRFGALEPLLASGAGAEALVPALAAVLASHEDGAPVEDAVATARFGREAAGRLARVCVHVEDYGTRSSTIVLVSPDGAVRVFHAGDAPCRSDFREVAI